MKIAVGVPTAEHEHHFRAPARALLERAASEIVWCEGAEPWSDAEKAERLADVDALITGWGDSGLSPSAIASARKLRLVAVLGGSVAQFSPNALFERGVRITHTARAIGVTVAEFALAGILGLAHNIPFLAREVERGEWAHETRQGAFNLSGKTVALIGCGAIGRQLIRLMSGFAVRVVVYDPYLSDWGIATLGAERVTLEDALRQADVVSLHAGLTDETWHMLGREQLALIRDGAVLVNTARGEVSDEDALAERLAAGTIRALLDVFRKEPLPADSPLRGLPNVVLTPHYAGVSEDTLERMGLDVVHDVIAFFDGRPLSHEVTPAMAARMT